MGDPSSYHKLPNLGDEALPSSGGQIPMTTPIRRHKNIAMRHMMSAGGQLRCLSGETHILRGGT
jgi:hypothetical protein